MSKIYDVVAITGEYEDALGEKKARYHNCGVIFSGKNDKLYLKLSCIPLDEQGKTINFFSLFDAERKT